MLFWRILVLLPGFVGPALWLAVFLAAMVSSALRFASRSKLEERLQGSKRRDRYLRYLAHSDRMIAFAGLVKVGATVTFALWLGLHIEGGHRFVAVGAAAVAAMFFGAELPGGLIGRKWSSVVLVPMLPPVVLCSFLLQPLYGLRDRVFGPDQEPDEEVVEAAKEELRVAIEDGATEGALKADEREMLKGILSFRDVEVHHILTPRTEMECLEVTTPVREAVHIVTNEFRHSRIPVYHETRDTVVGIIHVKDLMPLAGEGGDSGQTLRDVMREPYFVPETKGVSELLREFQRQHVQIAIAVDEYGGVTGLLTVEDIMEEIVGEIEDEYDQENHEDRIRRLAPHSIDVDARLPIREVNELLDLDLPENEDFDTVGGLVMDRMARVPSAGEQLRLGPLVIKILQSDDRKVERVLLELTGTGEADTPRC